MDDSDEKPYLRMEVDTPSPPHKERGGERATRRGLRSASRNPTPSKVAAVSKSPARKSPRLANKKAHVSNDSLLDITQSPGEPTPIPTRTRFREPRPQKPIITTNVMVALQKFKEGTERESRSSFLESNSDSSEAFEPSLQRRRLRYSRQNMSPRKTKTTEEIAPNVKKALKVLQAGQRSTAKDGEGESDVVSLEDDELDDPKTPAYIPRRKGTLKRVTANPKPAVDAPNLRAALAATAVETHGDDSSSDDTSKSPSMLKRKRRRKNTDTGPPQALLVPNLQAALQEYKKVQEKKKAKLRRSKNEIPKKASPIAGKATLDRSEGLDEPVGATFVDKEANAGPPRSVVSVSPEEDVINQRPENEENTRRRLSSEKRKSASSSNAEKTSHSYMRTDGSSAKQRFFRPRSLANAFEEPSVMPNEKASFKAQSQSTPRADKITNADNVLVPERPSSRMSVLSGISFASTALPDLEEHKNVLVTFRSTRSDSLANPNRIIERDEDESEEEAIVPTRNIVASRPAKLFDATQQLDGSKGRIEGIENVLIALPKAQDSSNQRPSLSQSGLGRKPDSEPLLTPGTTVPHSTSESNANIRSKSFQSNLSSVKGFTVAGQRGIEGVNNEDIEPDTSKNSKRDNNSSRKSRTIDELLAEVGEVDIGGPGTSKKQKTNSSTIDFAQDVRVQLSVTNSGTLQSVVNFDKSAAFVAAKQKLLDLNPVPKAISRDSSDGSVVSDSIEEQNNSQLSVSKVKETRSSTDKQNSESVDEPSDESADSGTSTDENPELVVLIDSAERQVVDSSDNLVEDPAIPEMGVEELEKQDEVQVEKAAAASYSIPEEFNPIRSNEGRISSTDVTLNGILTDLDARKSTWASTPMQRFLTNRRTDVENAVESSRNLQEKEVDKSRRNGKSWVKPGTSENTKGKSWAKPGTSESTRKEEDDNNLSDMINAMINKPSAMPKLDWQAIGKALPPPKDKPVKQRSMKEFVSSLSPGMQKHLAELPTTMGPQVIVPPKKKRMKRSMGPRKPRNDDPQPLYVTRANMGFYGKMPFNAAALTEMHAATAIWTDTVVEGLQEFLDYKNIPALRDFEDTFELTLYQGSFTSWREYSDFVRTHLPPDLCKLLVPFDMDLQSSETNLKWTVKTQKRIEIMVRQYAEIYAADDEDDQGS